MVRDPRLAGQAFEELVAVLREALNQPEQIRTIAIKLDLINAVSWAGDADHKWTSLLRIVAERPGALDDLLRLVDQKLQGTVYYQRFSDTVSKLEPIWERPDVLAPAPSAATPVDIAQSAPEGPIFIVHGSDTLRAESVAHTVGRARQANNDTERTTQSWPHYH